MNGLYDSYNANQGGGLFTPYASTASPEILAARGSAYNDSMIPWQDGLMSNDTGGLFENWSMGDTSDLVGSMGGLYQMYQGHQMLGLAKDDLSNKRRALDYNIGSDKAFKSATTQAFA